MSPSVFMFLLSTVLPTQSPTPMPGNHCTGAQRPVKVYDAVMDDDHPFDEEMGATYAVDCE